MKKKIITLTTVFALGIVGLVTVVSKSNAAKNKQEIVVTSCSSIPDAASDMAVAGSIAEIKTEEEVIAQADCMVAGTVLKREYKKISANNKDIYKTIISFQVNEVLKGEVLLSEITIMLPYNITESVKVSEGEYLEQLKEGAEAILVISPNEKGDYFSFGDTQISKHLVAQYQYSGGVQDIIVKNEEEILYDSHIYRNFSKLSTFDEIIQYMRNTSCNET